MIIYSYGYSSPPDLRAVDADAGGPHRLAADIQAATWSAGTNLLAYLATDGFIAHMGDYKLDVHVAAPDEVESPPRRRVRSEYPVERPSVVPCFWQQDGWASPRSVEASTMRSRHARGA